MVKAGVVDPTHILVAPPDMVGVVGKAFTVTVVAVLVAVHPPAFVTVTLISVVPADTPVTTPPVLIVATAVLLLVHVVVL